MVPVFGAIFAEAINGGASSNQAEQLKGCNAIKVHKGIPCVQTVNMWCQITTNAIHQKYYINMYRDVRS